jgi:outer membrane protein assembly factor BamD (BamD/ComL family)
MELSLLISDNTDEDSTTGALQIYSHADLLSFQNKDDEALKTLDSIEILYPGHAISDEVLFKKAQIKMKKGLFNDADSLYKKILDLYPDDILGDDALFKLAELNEYQFKNKEKAMELYQELLTKYPASLFVTEARKRFRALRGDQLN